MCVRAQFQANPKENHLTVVKNIIKYVKATTNHSFVGYTDADWGGCPDDRKNTFRGSFFWGKNVVSWYSWKQMSIFLSTADAEYSVAGSCCTRLIWMQ